VLKPLPEEWRPKWLREIEEKIREALTIRTPPPSPLPKLPTLEQIKKAIRETEAYLKELHEKYRKLMFKEAVKSCVERGRSTEDIFECISRVE